MVLFELLWILRTNQTNFCRNHDFQRLNMFRRDYRFFKVFSWIQISEILKRMADKNPHEKFDFHPHNSRGWQTTMSYLSSAFASLRPLSLSGKSGCRGTSFLSSWEEKWELNLSRHHQHQGLSFRQKNRLVLARKPTSHHHHL